MILANLMRRMTRSKRSASQIDGPGRRRLRLESLEERSLLAALYVDSTPGVNTFTPVGGSQVVTGGLTLGTDLFTTISGAVAAANPGDTINVADGTYSELVTVNKALTIRGNQFGVDARTRVAVPESIVNGTVLNFPFRTTAFYITAANVEIDGFTSRDQTDGNVFNAGIVLGPANTIRNNIITNNVIGIAGIVNSTSLIERNLFDGNNQPGSAGGAAIYTESTTNWTIDNNEIRNHSNNSPVIFAAVGAGAHTNLAFTNNFLHDNLSGVYALGISGGLFQGNTVRTNPVATGLTFAGANTSIDVLRNDLANNARGLRITDFGDLGGGTPNSDIEAHFNSFAGNTQFGAAIFNGGFGDPYSSAVLDLTCNWWGDVTGPTSAANPGGLGAVLQNDFADNIDFQPWLLYDDASAVQVGFQIPTSFTVNAQLGGFTATNNNYRRLVNAIDCLQNGQTVTLSGQFDWTEANAAASWALGNDGVASAADDFSLLVPANVNGVTLTALALGAARISGPGDLAAANLEGFLVFDGGDNQNWTISNLEIFNFDLGLGFFNGAGGTDAFNNTHIQNNRIRIPRDLNVLVAAADVNQNIGIHFSFGTNQVIQGNFLDIEGDGVSNGANFSSSVGMQSNTSGGNVYDGLLIDGNILTVLNAQSATPARILGIWENAHGHTSNITVSNNQFLNAAPGNNAALNLQRAFRVTSHSSAATSVTYSGNVVQGANIGFEWLAGQNFAGNLPVRLWQNTLTGNDTGVLIQSSGLANLYQNTITGSLTTGVNLDSGQLGPSGPVTRAVQENFISGGAVGLRLNAGTTVTGGIFNNQLGNTGLSINNLTGSLVDASGNFYGVNSPAGVAAKVTANVDYTPWLDVGTDTSATAGFQGNFSTLHVDDNSPQTGSTGRIQEGVNLVTPAGTVIVHAGLYVENVVVNKVVNLLGEQVGVDARGRVAAESIVTPAVAGNTTLELTTGSGASVIDGFTFTGGTALSMLRSTASAVNNNLQILNNRFDGFTGEAIFLDKPGDDVTISQNVVDGTSKTSGGGAVHLDTDTFNGFWLTNNWIINGVTGPGFFVDGARNVAPSAGRSPLISGNRFNGNDVGANIGKRSLQSATISNNEFTNNDLDGLQGGPKDSLITQNTFSGNDRWGLALTAFGTLTAGFGAINNTISENFFSSNTGIVPSGDVLFSTSQDDANNATNALFNNSLTSPVALSYSGAQIVNASGNWWNTSANPEFAGRIAGTGAANVDYTPWLNSSTDTNLVTPGFQGDFSVLNVDDDSPQSGPTGRITEAIADLTATGTINVFAGTYGESVDAAAPGKNVNLSPGASPGQIVLLSNLTLNAGDTLTMELNGTNPLSDYDNFVVNGTVSLGGANLAATAGFVYAPLSIIRLIDNDLGDLTSPGFAGLPDSSLVTISGQDFLIFYNGEDGNNVILVKTFAGFTPAITYAEDTAWNLLPNGTLVDGDLSTGAFDAAFLGYNAFGPFTNPPPTPGAIQKAVDAVLPGGLTIVNDGSYPENVVIAKDLTLDGQPTGGSANITGGGPGPRLSINAPATNVTIRDITLSGAGPALAVSMSPAAQLLLWNLNSAAAMSGGSINTVGTVTLRTNDAPNHAQVNGSSLGVVGEVLPISYVAVGTINVETLGGNDTIDAAPAPAGGALINIDGGSPTVGGPPAFNATAGDVPGDKLVLDMSATTGPVIVSTVTGLATSASHRPVNFRDIEDIDLIDNGVPTNTQMGDLYIRTTDGADVVQFSKTLTPNLYRVRINSQFPNLIATRKIIVYGRGGNDTIMMSNVSVDAELWGEGGNDYLSGYTGNDLLVGGDGNDRLIGYEGMNELWGDNKPVLPNDPLEGPADGDDQMSGGSGSDTAYGQGGSDLINVAGGDDYVNGGSGIDNVSGGDGNDRLYGGDGNDTLSGDGGNDLVAGNAGNDSLYGRAGDDVIIGGTGADILLGEDGNDLLFDGMVTDGMFSDASQLKNDGHDALMLALLTDWATDNILSAASLALAHPHDGELDTLSGGNGTDTASPGPEDSGDWELLLP